MSAHSHPPTGAAVPGKAPRTGVASIRAAGRWLATWRRLTGCAVLLLSSLAAQAGIPDRFQPLIIEAPFSFSERQFDLTDALERAQRDGKPMLIYVGAQDCPPCRNIELFLDKHAEQLKPALDKVIVVDIRSWLRGPKLQFKVRDQVFSWAEFKAAIGDANPNRSYPTFWLISPQLRQVKQLPAGSSHFMDVERFTEAIKQP